MIFSNFYLFPIVFVILAGTLLLLLKTRFGYNNFIKKHFFIRQTKISTLSFAFLIFSLILLFLIPLKLMKPFSGAEDISNSRISINIDVSGSMLTAGFDGNKTRLRQGLEFLEELLNELPNNFEVSISIFAHNLIRLTPFTNDKSYLKNILQLVYLSREEFYDIGTDLVNVLNEYNNEAKEDDFVQSLFLTDGGDDEYLDIKLLKENIKNVKFLGVGDLTPRSIKVNGTSKKYENKIILTKRNDRGIRKLCESLLKCDYFILADFKVKRLISTLNSDFEGNKKIVKSDQSKNILAVALFLFIISNILSIFCAPYKILSVSLIFLFCFNSYGNLVSEEFNYFLKPYNELNKINYANKNYLQGRYKIAEILYKELKKECHLCEYQNQIYFNYGTLLLINGKMQKGIDYFDKESFIFANKNDEIEYRKKIASNLLFVLKRNNNLKLNNEDGAYLEPISIQGKQNLYLKPLMDEESLQQEMLQSLLKLKIKKQKNMGKDW